MPSQDELLLAVPEALALRSSAPAFSGHEAAAIDCDLIAPWYEPVEHLCFGTALEMRRNTFIPYLGDARKALSCGEGDGRFMTALLKANSEVEITAIDASRKMARVAERRVASLGSEGQGRDTYHCGSIHNFVSPHAGYDLIATHFFLDCFSGEEAAVVIDRIADWAAPRSRWIVSEFAQPTSAMGYLWTGAVIRSLYAAFRVTTGLRITHLPDYRPAMRRAGFELRRQEHAVGGLLVSELWERE
jgi:ubiquinone/menaquinone biosynthesis C-methylase UbiE